ncbi:MAG TPA: tetratricopeptide repeat protein, partial [Ferruginibacter sp.]|nr:tetratricopeptide repeat protein [Ferruginibacter sp.]
MKQFKACVLFLAAIMAVSFSKAQSIDEGKNYLYYEKFISAKNTFQKLVDANPSNAEAAYWLGQAMIAPEDKDIAGAKAVYQKALNANSNSALLIAGMGHIALLEGNTSDARSRFETALSLSGGKDVAVLNAIGVANGDFDVKAGDGNYAIDKLKQATNIKAGKTAEIYTNLGDAYRKITDGTNATLSYDAALAINPRYARAIYRKGRVYQTQGSQQKDIFLKFYADAIAADPNYTPVYWTLHQYYYEIDVNKSAEYLDKYLAAKGADEPNTCFLKAQMKYAQGAFQDAIVAAKACIDQAGANPYPNLYGLIA